MSKRTPAAASSSASTSAAPPLPAGPQPTPEQQAAINAAWSQYYASQGTVVPPTPSTAASSQPNAAQYANYGYGAGAPMSSMAASTPGSAGFPPSAGGMPQHPQQMQQAQGYATGPVGYMVPHHPYGGGVPAQGFMPQQQQQQPQMMQQQQQGYPHPHVQAMGYQPIPQVVPMHHQAPVHGQMMGGMPQGAGMMQVPPGQPVWGGPPGHAPQQQGGPMAGPQQMGGGRPGGGFRPGPGPGGPRPGPGGPGGAPGQGAGRPGFAGGASGGLGIAQPMSQAPGPGGPQQPGNAQQHPQQGPPAPGGAGFRPSPHSSLPRAPSNIPSNPTLRTNVRSAGLPAAPPPPASSSSQGGPSGHHHQGGPPAKRPRTDGPGGSSAYSPTPSMRSTVGGGGGRDYPSGSSTRGGRPGGGEMGDRSYRPVRREYEYDRDSRDSRGDRGGDRDGGRDRYERRSDFGGGSTDGRSGPSSSSYPRGGRGGGRGGSGLVSGRDRGGSLLSGPAGDSRFGSGRGGLTAGGSSRGGGAGRGGSSIGRGGALSSSSTSRYASGGPSSGPGVAGAPKGPSGRGGLIGSTRGVRGGRGDSRMVGSGRPVHPGSALAGKAAGGKAATAVVDVEREKVAKEEARRRTLTDFRIVGLEIKALGWKWGVVRPVRSDDDEDDEEEDEDDEDRKSETGGEEKVEEGARDAIKETETAAEEAEVERDIIKTEPVAEGVTEPIVQVEVKVEETTVAPAVKETQGESETVVLAANTDSAIEGQNVKDTKQTDVTTDDTSASVAQVANQSEKEQTNDKAAVVASSTTVGGKRGEKRKAKMSSPDADDDSLIMSKKRTTHGPIIRKESVAPSPEKNRFRIYFASPVEAADGPSLRALQNMNTVEEEHQDGPEAGSDQEQEQPEDGEEHVAEDGEHEGEEGHDEEYYEAESEERDGDEEAEEEIINGEAENEEPVPPATENDVSEMNGEEADKDVGEMSGIVEETQQDDSENKPEGHDKEMEAEIEQVERKQSDNEARSDVAMREPSVAVEEKTTVESKVENAAETTEVKQEHRSEKEPDVTEENVAPVAAEPAVTSTETTKPTTQSTPGKPKATKPAPYAPREPSSLRFADSRFRRSPSLPATSSDTPRPESNRLSILYANGKRRICLNSAIVESVNIHRKNGSIQVVLDASAVKRKWDQDQQVDQIAKRMKETEVVDKQDEEKKETEAKEGETGTEVQDGEKKEAKTEIEVKKPVNEAAKPEEWSFTKGILVEALNEQHNTFGPIATSTLEEIWSSSTSSAPTSMEDTPTAANPEAATESEIDFPPFHRLVESLLQSQEGVNVDSDAPDGVEASKLSTPGGLRLEITAYLDKDRPLTEPKWVKSGHLEDWIKPAGLMVGGSGSGRAGGRAGAAAKLDDGDEAGSGWKDKLKVVDPDAPPTISSVLENWALASKAGTLKERRRFVNGHLSSLNNMVQILLRAVRGPETTPLPRSTLSTTHGALRSAISPKDFYYTKQSYTSLAVMAIINMVKDYSIRVDESRTMLEEKIGGVIKSLPNAVVFAATDSLFVEWTTQEPRGAGPTGRM